MPLSGSVTSPAEIAPSPRTVCSQIEVHTSAPNADADSTITPGLLSPEIQASRRTVRVLPSDEPELRVRLDQPLGDRDGFRRRVLDAVEHHDGTGFAALFTGRLP